MGKRPTEIKTLTYRDSSFCTVVKKVSLFKRKVLQPPKEEVDGPSGGNVHEVRRRGKDVRLSQLGSSRFHVLLIQIPFRPLSVLTDVFIFCYSLFTYFSPNSDNKYPTTDVLRFHFKYLYFIFS